jgi:hypothetical protein
MAGAGGSAAGQSGASGTTGAAGTGGASACAFDVHASLSTAIPTVGIVTFTTGLSGIAAAEIRFGRASTGPTMTAPVDLTQPDHRTLLLGMKPSQPYVFRIVATSAGGTCTSEDQTLMTGALPAGPPSVMAAIANAAAHAGGFIITTTTTAPTGAYIIDADGTPVWWAPFPTVTSRAHMGWDGRDMYIVAQNPNGVAPGATARVSMDGLNVENALSGLDQSHHDLTAIPGGIAVLSWHGAGTSVVERAADGTVTMVAELANVYNNAVHANALHYTPWDDSYTVSDRNANLFVKITRKGQLVWQIGGTNPKDPSKFFTGLPAWTFNQGHHLLADGTFLFFNNGNSGTEPSTARVFKLDTTTMTATSLLAYKPAAGAGVASLILGDVQRLPNGNMLVTFSSVGLMQEVDPSGQLVASFRTQTQGYAEYRDTLYGPPPY